MHRQVFHFSACLGPANLDAPSVFDVGPDHVRRKRERRISPQVLVVIGSLDVLRVIEFLDGLRVRAVGEPEHEAGKHEAHISGVFGLAERIPFEELGSFHVIVKVLDLGEVLDRLLAEELRARRSQKRAMAGGRNLRNVLQKGDVGRAAVEFEIRNDRPVRFAAGSVVFAHVHVFVKAGLDCFRRVFEVLGEVFLRCVKNVDFGVLLEIGAVDKELEAPPCRFHLLEVRMVHDLVDLERQLPVYFADVVVEHRLVDPVDALA